MAAKDISEKQLLRSLSPHPCKGRSPQQKRSGLYAAISRAFDDEDEKYGVKEYWIIDPVSRYIDVYILKGGKLTIDESYHSYFPEHWAEMTEKERAEVKLSLKLSLYNELEINLAEIFDD